MVSSKGRTRVRVRSGVLGIALIIIMVTFVGLRNAEAATTHYIAANGSDSNNGTGKTTPWLHLPGMPNCSSACGSYTPVAGDQFILRGGDTWGSASLGVDWSWSGASGAHIYIGVDQTYFAGASWARPIFNCQNTDCGGTQMNINGSYVTVDNIEFTGLRFTNTTAKGVQTLSDHTEVENCYFHGWSHAAGFNNGNDDGPGFMLAANTSNGAAAVAGAAFHDNVVDGQDTSQDMVGGADDSEQVYNNVFRYVYNCVRGNHNDIHGNLCENVVIEGWPNADHANGISIFGPISGTSMWVYNNVLRNIVPSALGAEALWLHSLGDASGQNTYVYNNVIYNIGRGIDLGDHPPASGGTINAFNNTVEASGDHCIGNGESGVRMTINYGNNHCINASTACTTASATCNNLGGNLSQTTAQANTAGYNSSQTYAYSPTASNSPTVEAGSNLTSSCAGNVAALCSDTTYPTYDAVNHKVVMRTVVPRPSSGAWDIGAYKYSAQAQAPAPPPPPGPLPAPPTNLTGVVH